MDPLPAGPAIAAAPRAPLTSIPRASIARRLAFTVLPPLALYVHLPWCIRKCPYCDFNSYEAGRGGFDDTRYVDALLRDLDAESAARARPRAGERVHRRRHAELVLRRGDRAAARGHTRAPRISTPSVEVTLEANPGAVEAARFAEYRDAGVNRLSIGVQSFRAEQLRRLGRVHGPDEAARAIELARSAGFATFNVDLMYALPERRSRWGARGPARGARARAAASFVVSAHARAEHGVSIASRRRCRPRISCSRSSAAGRELLAASGYRRYEMSAYERGGRRCAHNLNYWRFGDYLGIGAGAHGKVTLPEEHAIERRAKARKPRTYEDAAGTPRAVAVERIDDARQVARRVPDERAAPAGRRAARFVRREGGATGGAIEGPLRAARERDWLADEPGVLRPTAAGLDVLNRLLALFC